MTHFQNFLKYLEIYSCNLFPRTFQVTKRVHNQKISFRWLHYFTRKLRNILTLFEFRRWTIFYFAQSFCKTWPELIVKSSIDYMNWRPIGTKEVQMYTNWIDFKQVSNHKCRHLDFNNRTPLSECCCQAIVIPSVHAYIRSTVGRTASLAPHSGKNESC